MKLKHFIEKFKQQYYWLLRHRPDLIEKHLVRENKHKGYYTENRILSIAAQHTTISEWKKADSTSYVLASRRGLLKQATKHMKAKVDYSEEACLAEAILFNSKSEWLKNGKLVTAAQNKGKAFYKKCTSHMNLKRISGKAKPIKNLDTGQIFRCMSEVPGISGRGIHKLLNDKSGRLKTAGGYRWAYYDEKIHGPIETLPDGSMRVKK